MITNLKKHLINILSKRFGLVPDSVVFLKFNTPISGTGLGNKVLFFVFINNEKKPRFIVKTVRNHEDFNVIRNGHSRLIRLNQFVEGSKFSNIVPKALFIFEDENDVWSIETVCTGQKTNIYIDIEKILNEYVSLSRYIFEQEKDFIKINYSYTENLIKNFSGDHQIINDLMMYSKELWKTYEIGLPAIPQHGDFTTDNILVDNNKYKIIDCDMFGVVKIPGFDIFHLLTRGTNIKSKKDYLNNYFDQMNINYEIDKKLLFVYFLHELNIKRDYILKDSSIISIIDKFQNVIVSYL